MRRGGRVDGARDGVRAPDVENSRDVGAGTEAHYTSVSAEHDFKASLTHGRLSRPPPSQCWDSGRST